MDQFLYVVSCLLNNNVEPSIVPEIRKILHLSEHTRIGDWYLYQIYIEIRIYGYELPPYRLPKFVPIQNFELEYITKMINMDQLHFVAVKKKDQFKTKTQ